jgi:hypothetical protein
LPTGLKEGVQLVYKEYEKTMKGFSNGSNWRN